jgi:uncharacterized protein DUF3500
MKTTVIRLGVIAAAAVLLTAAFNRTNSISMMTESANRFLASLTAEQRSKAVWTFEDAERQNWIFTPTPARKGLGLLDMTPYQKHLASALLSAGLSQSGYIKAVSIMSLEDVLRIMEGARSAPVRDPEKYYFWVFGTPSDNGTWGYRVEGHHLSQSFTIANGRVMAAPSFYGTNPADIKEGPRAGMRVLAAEEDLARDLVQSLDAEQKKTGIVAEKAPNDILTGNTRKAALSGQPSGISATKFNSKQVEKLHALLDEYVSNLPEQLAAVRKDQIKKAGKNIFFAWAGGVNRGDQHYYRVQTDTFLIEFDNTQNGGNHVHSVWRDFNGDFGADLLKAHYDTSHKK